MPGGYCQLNGTRPKWSCYTESWLHPSSTHDVLPHRKRPRSQNPIIDRLHQVAAKTKQVLRQSMECEKPLSLSRRGKPTHVPFSLARRFVRHFRSIVCIDMIDVRHRRHHGPMSRIIASQFIGDQPVWSKNSCGLSIIL